MAFGETFTSKTGRKVTMSKLEDFKPSQTAAIDTPFPVKQFRKVKITVMNSSQEAFDMGQLFLTATSNEEQVNAATDVAARIGTPPTATLLPGRNVSWTEAYPVVVGKNLSIEVGTVGGKVAIWDGQVK